MRNRIIGSRNDDELEGTSGNDIINGRAGDDFIIGGAGNDILNGGRGQDTFSLFQGDATGRELDMINGGAGRDRLVIEGSRNDFEFNRLDDGSIQVNEIGTSRSAIVTNVEQVNFGEGNININDLVETNSDSPIPITIGNAPITGSFDAGRNDIDVYEFTLGEGEIINFNPISATTIPLRIIDVDGNTVVGGNTAGRSPIADGPIAIGNVPAGTYFLVANNQGLGGSFFSGDYEIQATRVVDQVGDTAADATSINADGQTIEVALDLRDDRDVFAINVTDGQVLDFDLTGESNTTFVNLSDSAGNQLLMRDGSLSARSDFSFEADFSGTLFVTFGLAARGGPSNGVRVNTLEFTVTDVTPSTEEQANVITGTNGRDTLRGTDGDDIISGEGRGDSLNGGLGNDTLDGGRGDDVLEGGLGNDTLLGGRGDDLFIAFNGNSTALDVDTIDGGLGDQDEIRIIDSNPENFSFTEQDDGSILINEIGTQRSAVVTNVELVSFVSSGGSVDINSLLDGGAAPAPAPVPTPAPTPPSNVITGTSGSDNLTGTNGNDTISGGGGADIVDGGRGNDTLSGLCLCPWQRF